MAGRGEKRGGEDSSRLFSSSTSWERHRSSFGHSNKRKFSLQRNDPFRWKLVDIEESKSVFELLQIGRLELKFDRNAKLLALHELTHATLHERSLVRDIPRPSIILIKEIENVKNDNSKRENTSVDGKGTGESSSKRIHKSFPKFSDHGSERDAGFTTLPNLHGKPEGQSSTSILHQSDLPRRTGRNDPAQKKKGNREEIETLNRKLNSMKVPRGFSYQIMPNDYTKTDDVNDIKVRFASKEQQKAKQSKISNTKNWYSWDTSERFPCWAVRVDGSVGSVTSPWQDGGNDPPNPEWKTRTAIVTKTSFHEVRNFCVQVMLNDMAIKDAKKILKARRGEERQAVKNFVKKYCSYVYCGNFSAGGWHRIEATANCHKDKEFATLVEKADKKLESPNSYFSDPGSKVYVTVREEYDQNVFFGGRKLTGRADQVSNCTIFPSVRATKSQFKPIYEIMEGQADAEGDKDLYAVSTIIKTHMEGAKTFAEVETKMENQIDTTEDKKLREGIRRIQMEDTKRSPHYAVFLGDVGTGKSTVVEKLTGQTGRSSKASESFTRTSKLFRVPDGSLIVSDTPGSNARKDKLEHNHWIAGALNFMPVSKIFIVVKAETRIDSVIDSVLKYADNFVELPFDLVAVLVTHMDMVEWPKEEFIEVLDEELGIDTVVFSWNTTKGETLLDDILKTCKERHNLTINDENFLKLFKIHNSHRKILQFTSDEIKIFSGKMIAFDEQRKAFSESDQVDLVFEFQAYMTDEIFDIKERMIAYNSFTFEGERAAIEAGHVLNMVNQLHMVLRDISTECTRQNCENGESEFRKCPYCGLIWTKDEGCSGDTICGDAQSPPDCDTSESSGVAALGTFTFKWNGSKLEITKSDNKDTESGKTTEICKNTESSTNTEECYTAKFGCKKTINWNDMAMVRVPSEISNAFVHKSKETIEAPQSWTSFGGGRVQELVNKFDCLGSLFT